MAGLDPARLDQASQGPARQHKARNMHSYWFGAARQDGTWHDWTGPGLIWHGSIRQGNLNVKEQR